MENKIAVIGDIHGRLDLLKALCIKIKKECGDIKTYSTGDLIDRGLDSRGVIDYCIDNDIDITLGNHDEWLYKLLVHYKFEPYALTPIMGGMATILSYGVTKSPQRGDSDSDIAMDIYSRVPQKHKDWIKKQPLFRKVVLSSGEIYWLLHAGLTKYAAEGFLKVTSNDLELMSSFSKYQKSRDLLLWARPNFPKVYPKNPNLSKAYPKILTGSPVVNRLGKAIEIDDLYKFRNNATQIFGHSIRKNVVIDKHYIAIDTGCGTQVGMAKLSAIILPERKVISVEEYELMAGKKTSFKK